MSRGEFWELSQCDAMQFAKRARDARALQRSPAQRFFFSLGGFLGGVDGGYVPERVVTMILRR